MQKNPHPTTAPKQGISIIIPLAENETLWRELLCVLPIDIHQDEILLAAAHPPPDDWQHTKPPTAKWLHCDHSGRAVQMNTAAATAQKAFLWFLHADSKPAADALWQLRQSLINTPDGVHYFDLRFYDGGWKMRINEWGVRLRCALFQNPFGDQALAMSGKTFAALGGFDPTAEYGEDHLLVLAARRQQKPIKRINSVIHTSARRYEKNGWWNTVLLFQRLWLRQWRRR